MQKSYTAYKMTLRPIEIADLDKLRKWRNSDEIRNFMLDQSVISKQQQFDWFSSLDRKVDEIHFSVDYKGNFVGYANVKQLRDINKLNTGLYIGDAQYRGTFLAQCLGLALLDYCFNVLNVDRVFAQVLEENNAALRYNRLFGYEVSHIDTGIVYMQLSSSNYEREKKKIIRFIR